MRPTTYPDSHAMGFLAPREGVFMAREGKDTVDSDGVDTFLSDLRERFGGRSAQRAQIYQDLRYLLHELAEQKKLEEAALRSLSSKIRAYLESLHGREISFEQVEYHEISELRDPALEWKPVKVRAILEKMTEPMAVALGGEKHLFTTMTFRE